ncbi:MAG TPA: ribonuclease III [Polyangiaceae bacterium]
MIPDPEIAAKKTLLATIETIVGAGEIPRFSEALTHPSYANESRAADNQRLEFLGDAVLGLCVSELLSTNFPNANEGALTRMRSALVNAEALARWARSIDLGSAIVVGKGAKASKEREQTNVLADAVEAIVAAVYEARGLDAARALVRAIVQEPLAASDFLDGRDPKSELQERIQASGLAAPVYRVIETRGPAHDPMFVVAVTVGANELARGEGKSKRLAERAAAALAIKGL